MIYMYMKFGTNKTSVGNQEIIYNSKRERNNENKP